MTKRIILVTGGAGYIGNRRCKALAQAGSIPVALDNLVYGYREAVRLGPNDQADILARAAQDRTMAVCRLATLLNFATFADVSESVSAPDKCGQNNVYSPLNLLQAMHQAGCRDIVFPSNCAMYGAPESRPTAKGHPHG